MPKPDSKINDPDFMSKTAKKMAEIGLSGYDEEDEVIDGVEDEVKDEPKGDDGSTPDTPAEDDNVDSLDDKTDDATNEDGEAEDNIPTLPDALRRSAIHQQWTQDEIDEFMKADPEKALKTFEKIHESNNRITAEFSKLGQAALTAQDKEDRSQQMTDSQPDDDIMKIIGNLEKEHAGDPLYEDVVKPMARVIQKVQGQANVSRPATQPTPTERGQYRDGLVQQINEFFGQETFRDYDEFYGTPGQPKTNDQLGSYDKVLVLADQIVAGSILQEKEISVPDALEMAHLVIAEPFRKDATQQEMKRSVKRRGKGVQLKPNASAAADDTTGTSEKPKSRSQLHARTRQRLKDTFKNM